MSIDYTGFAFPKTAGTKAKKENSPAVRRSGRPRG